jgi:hypothetical protein
MTQDEYRRFAMKSESLVKPIDATAISFLGDFNKYLPKDVQRSVMEKGSRSIPYMGFIVDPYCFFLSFPIKDEAAAAAMLPDGYELAPTSIFRDEPKRPMAIISSFAVRTSVFTGMRVECYLIARDKATGRMAWIIAEYETNTTSHDPKNGFCGYTCDPALFTTTPYGELLVEATNGERGRRFALEVDIREGETRDLDEPLWVEGNMMVDYGGELKDPHSKSFSLIFDPFLMKEAKAIPLDRVRIVANTMMAGVIDAERPTSAALFPYTQHFVIRQDLAEKEIATGGHLIEQARIFLERTGFKTMKGDDIKKPLLRGMMVSAIVNLGIIVTLALLLIL